MLTSVRHKACEKLHVSKAVQIGASSGLQNKPCVQTSSLSVVEHSLNGDPIIVNRLAIFTSLSWRRVIVTDPAAFCSSKICKNVDSFVSFRFLCFLSYCQQCVR